MIGHRVNKGELIVDSWNRVLISLEDSWVQVVIANGKGAAVVFSQQVTPDMLVNN